MRGIPDDLRDKVYREARSYADHQVELDPHLGNLSEEVKTRIKQTIDAVVGYATQDIDFRLRHEKTA